MRKTIENLNLEYLLNAKLSSTYNQDHCKPF